MKLGGSWVSFASILIFLVIWEVACRLQWVNPVLLSSPTEIYDTWIDLYDDRRFYSDVLFTLRAYGLSLLLAVILGSCLGFAIGYSLTVYRILNPFVVTVNSLPKIVLMPLIVLWVGIGMTANVLLGTLMAAFPITISTYTGVRNLEQDHLILARSFGASPWKIISSVVLPSVIPYTLAGLRVGINYAMVGVLIAEFFASSQGIGNRMVQFMSNFEIDAFFVCLVMVAVVTLTGTSFVHWLERRISVQPTALEVYRGM